VLDSLIQWAGVVDELDFAKRLHSWSKTGFPELGDSDGYTYCNTVVKVIILQWCITYRTIVFAAG
jgi:RNA processing factor Prp31